MMRKIKLIFIVTLVGIFLTDFSSLKAQEKTEEKESPEMKKTAEPFEFYSNVQTIDELDDEVDDSEKDEPVVLAEDEGNVVYRMPESCREFSAYLQRKQDNLKTLEQEIKNREELLEKMQTEFQNLMNKYAVVESKLKELVKSEPGNLKDNPELVKMIKLYEGLAPEEAAARLRNLDLDFTLALLRGMKPKKLGQIMAALDPKLSAALSSQIVRGF